LPRCRENWVKEKYRQCHHKTLPTQGQQYARDLRQRSAMVHVVESCGQKGQAERAGPKGQRREDGSPLGPTPGDARDRFTTAVPD